MWGSNYYRDFILNSKYRRLWLQDSCRCSDVRSQALQTCRRLPPKADGLDTHTHTHGYMYSLTPTQWLTRNPHSKGEIFVAPNFEIKMRKCREWIFLHFLILSPFPPHFLILSPFSRRQTAKLPQFVQTSVKLKKLWNEYLSLTLPSLFKSVIN